MKTRTRTVITACIAFLAVGIIAFTMFRFAGDPVNQMVVRGLLNVRNAGASRSGVMRVRH